MVWGFVKMKNMVFIKIVAIAAVVLSFAQISGMEHQQESNDIVAAMVAQNPELATSAEAIKNKIIKKIEEQNKKDEAERTRREELKSKRGISTRGKIAAVIAAGLVLVGGVVALNMLYQKYMGQRSSLPSLSMPSWINNYTQSVTNWFAGVGSFGR